jgi:ketosteroid isomerase-like protein
MAGDRRGSPVAFVKVGMMDSEKQPAMAARKQAGQQYFEGFRRSDHEAILALVSDDVVWDLPGFRHLEGRAAFDSEIENPDFEGSPRRARRTATARAATRRPDPATPLRA